MIPRASSNEHGLGVIEALCAVTIIAISIAGSISLYLNTMRNLASARTYSGVSADVEAIVESLRNETYAELLTHYNKPYTSIADGETVTITPTTYESKADYTVTLHAIKNQQETIPEAVQVEIQAEQRGGKSGTKTYDFSTLIAQTE